ncbi:hypothetical protein A2U01_0005775 [Trifolium medium]|uniref:Uncharacterized protein n=1 Tax=Trifolium medium TaxID=97028 RepID=A0A392MBP4_9FABA|nr:hypothetical protein [Trifolium medium]
MNEQEAREGFCSQIKRLTDIEKETSICINRHVDLGKTALYIAAEDDSLVSHSSVPLPVDDFVSRLDDLSMDYCPYYNPQCDSSPEKFFESIERFLYVHKNEVEWNGKGWNELIFHCLDFKINNGMEWNSMEWIPSNTTTYLQFCSPPIWEVNDGI